MDYMIDVRRLQILRELDRCGTIAATAQSVHLTPSAVSQQLTALSREAGTPMLEPDGRRVRLTEAAQLLLSHAHQVFIHLEHAEADLAAFRKGDAGTVRLGSFASGIAAIAVPAMAELAASSKLQVHIREVQPETATDALLARAVDVSLVLTAGSLWIDHPDPRLEVRELLADPLDIALPAGHPLVDRAAVDLVDLADEDWIGNHPAAPCWQITQAACQEAGFLPRDRHHADDFTGVIALVGAGAGVAMLPRLAQSTLPCGPVAIRPIAGSTPTRRIGAHLRSGTADQPHIKPLLAALHSAGRKLSAMMAESRPVPPPLRQRTA